MGILDINTKKHSGASSRPFWEGYYPLETKGAGAPWLRAYQHSWITYLEASSHSSSLSLYRKHTKLSYISQRFPLKHIDYLSCYTVVKSGELYKWRRSLHLFFYLIFISQCPLTFQTLVPAGYSIHSLVTKSFSHFHSPKTILSLFFTKQKFILISAKFGFLSSTIDGFPPGHSSLPFLLPRVSLLRPWRLEHGL